VLHICDRNASLTFFNH